MAIINGVIRNSTAQYIYSDKARPYAERLNGQVVTRRASYVEPSDRDPLRWMVDFSPLGGGRHYKDKLGQPFEERAAALAYEAELLVNWMHSSTPDPEALSSSSF